MRCYNIGSLESVLDLQGCGEFDDSIEHPFCDWGIELTYKKSVEMVPHLKLGIDNLLFWIYEERRRNIDFIYEIFKPIGDYNIQKLIFPEQVVVFV